MCASDASMHHHHRAKKTRKGIDMRCSKTSTKRKMMSCALVCVFFSSIRMQGAYGLVVSPDKRPRLSQPLRASEVEPLAPLDVRFTEVTSTRSGSVDFVNRAVKRLVGDIEKVDVEILRRSQLRKGESWTLWGALGIACIFALWPSHFMGHMSHYALPACTATIACVGAVSEYLGGTNAATAQEISAVAVRAAAEAEELLSQAERTKAVLPVCVVFSAATAALSVLSSKAIEVLYEDLKVLQTVGPVGTLVGSGAKSAAGVKAVVATSTAATMGTDLLYHQSQDTLSTMMLLPDQQSTVGEWVVAAPASAADAQVSGLEQAIASTVDSLGEQVSSLSDSIDIPEQVRTAYLLVCPVATILAATVAQLAQIEVSTKCEKAQNLGRRRFATRRDVGRTWQSRTELVNKEKSREQQTLAGFGTSLIPGPLAATLVTEGGVPFKAVVASAAAAAQAAYYLTVAEYSLARATESVSAKARTAALAEAWSSQAQLANGRVPATSSVAILMLALTCLGVELLPRATCLAFPLAAAFFVTLSAKYRALTRGAVEAVSAAADQLAGLDDGSDDDPLLPLVLTYRNLFAALTATRNELQLRRRASTLWFRRQIFGTPSPSPAPVPAPPAPVQVKKKSIRSRSKATAKHDDDDKEAFLEPTLLTSDLKADDGHKASSTSQ